MRYLILLASLPLIAAPYAGSVEEELELQRGDCIEAQEELNFLNEFEVIYWHYLQGRIDQIETTLKIMGH